MSRESDPTSDPTWAALSMSGEAIDANLSLAALVNDTSEFCALCDIDNRTFPNSTNSDLNSFYFFQVMSKFQGQSIKIFQMLGVYF